MARPRKDSAGPAEHVTVRLTPTGIARLDALVAQYGLSRADVFERLLERASPGYVAAKSTPTTTRDVEPAFKGAKSEAQAQRVEKAAHEATMAELERVRIAGAARDTEDMAELMARRGMPVPPPKVLDPGSEDLDEPDLDDLDDDEGPLT
jgi:hypothetical protein